MDKAIEMRNELKELSKERGIKMTYTPIFIKAVSLALRQFPVINASVDDKLENITYKVIVPFILLNILKCQIKK